MSAVLSTRAKKIKRRATKAGLQYVNSFDSGITRVRRGKGFSYSYQSGRTVKSKRVRERIDSLVIPPAWEEVWICRAAKGHIQAVGLDEAGRRQYIYHEAWSAVRTAAKFDRMQLFAELLPRIRRRVRKDLAGKTVTKARLLAAVTRLLDKAHLRVGNERYSSERGTRGATTLLGSNAKIEGSSVCLDFKGKSGRKRHVEFRDGKVADVISRCEEIEGQFLFSFVDDRGDCRPITSSDVNAYLSEISGEKVTAKDFRTWWGSVIAAEELGNRLEEKAELKKKDVVESVKAVAAELGNTVAVCKSSYIHPGILAAAESGELPALLKECGQTADDISELTLAEELFVTLLPRLEFS